MTHRDGHKHLLIKEFQGRGINLELIGGRKISLGADWWKS